MNTRREPAVEAQNTIYFVTVVLDETVHCIGLGFTKQVYYYVYGASDAAAVEAAGKWATQEGCKVNRGIAIRAVEQDVSAYYFPENIINLPQDLLTQAFDRCGRPHEKRPARRTVSPAL